MSQPSGLQFAARVGALPSDTFAVVEFTLTEHLSETFTLDVELASLSPDVAVADVLDQSAELTIYQDGELLRRVQGIVSAFQHSDTGHHRTRYSIRVVPALWRLALMHNSRIFQQQDSQRIAQTLLDERGVVDTRFNLKRSPAEREYCVQYRESDLDFLQRLAAEEGWHFRFDSEQAGQPLIIADHHRDAPRLADAGYNATAGGSSRQACVYRFGHNEQIAPTRAVLKDYTFRNPAYALLHDEQTGQLTARDDYEHYDYPGRFKTDGTGRPYAAARLDALRRNTSVATGGSNRPDFTSGARVTLTDHPQPEQNRTWLLTRVTHTGKQPQAMENESGSGLTTYHNTFDAIPADRTWRPALEPRRHLRMDGPHIAIVTGPAGEEIHCDEHGRVKVRFPWDRYSASDEHSSAWLRVSQGWAGGRYGFMALPRIGHEVIVDFLDGDPDQPVITGRTYHAANTPPYALPEHKTRTTLKTRTHKGDGSNELRFEDEANKQQIYVHAQRDLDLLTENDRTEVIHNNSHLTVDNDRYAHIKANDHSTVDGEKRESIGQDASLTVGGTLHQKTGTALLSEAGREVHHKAGSKVVLDAGAELTIAAGGSFLKLDPSGITLSGPSIRINSGGAPGSGSGQSATVPGVPHGLSISEGKKVAPEKLADVGQRADAKAIEAQSKQAASFRQAAKQQAPFAEVCEARQKPGNTA